MGILVIAPGMQTLIQDVGRPGYARFGVARSGAFDLQAWRWANRLVGNEVPAEQSDNVPGPATLEVLVGGLEFITTAAITLAVSGADVVITATDSTGGQRELARDTAHHIEPGVTVTLSRTKAGLRSYVAFQGGLAAAQILGSRSYDTTAQLGPLPLTAGLELAIGTCDIADPQKEPAQPARSPSTSFPITPGHDEHLLKQGVASLAAATWKIAPSSSRAGIRLTPTADQAPLVTEAFLPSSPALPGAIQAFPSGELVVLGPDGPTTGGYPVVAVMSRGGLSRLSQIRPGTTITLAHCADTP
jgi:biotin-dependent carboxylase-like uncharacterized protein